MSNDTSGFGGQAPTGAQADDAPFTDYWCNCFRVEAPYWALDSMKIGVRDYGALLFVGLPVTCTLAGSPVAPVRLED